MRFLLDTDHVSIIQRGKGREFDCISSRMASLSDNDVVVGIVSFHEQVNGANAFIQQSKTLDGVVRGYEMLRNILTFYSTIRVLPFDSLSSEVFAEQSAPRIRVSTMDLRIASIARANGLIVVTRNRRDFERVPGLVVEDWTK